MRNPPTRGSVRREGPRGEPGFPPRSWLLDVVDVGEADHHQRDQDDEEDFHPDREPDHPLRPARPLAAALAVGRVSHQRRLASITVGLHGGDHQLSMPKFSIGATALPLASVPQEATMGTEDVVVLMAMVPERVNDLVAGLDEQRLTYRHAPAFPTLKEVIGHLCSAGPTVDALLRHAYLDGLRELPVRASLDPASPEPDLSPPLDELV